MSPTKTILIADDDPSITQFMQTILSHSMGCTVVIAHDGEEAWQAVQENKFDLIISDWNMPIKTGSQLLEDVRKSEQFTHIPFLMLTSRSDKESVMEAIGAGVSQYMHKPFEQQMLIAKVAQILELDLSISSDDALGLPDDDSLLEG